MKIVGKPRSVKGQPKGMISTSGKVTPVLATVQNAQGKRSKAKRRLSQTKK